MRVKQHQENKRFEYQSKYFIKYLDVKWRVSKRRNRKSLLLFFSRSIIASTKGKFGLIILRLPNGDVCCHTSLLLISAYEKALSAIPK